MYENIFGVLEEIGLSRNESKVYLALLKIGVSRTGRISQEAKIDRANTYYSLKKLEEKSLASCVEKNGIKEFEAADPDMLSKMLDEKKAKVKNILPSLRVNQEKTTESTKIFKGYKAYQSIIESMAKKDDEILIIGNYPKTALKYCRLQELRKENHVKIRTISQTTQKLPLMEHRMNSFEQPVSTYISNQEVMLVVWGKNPKVTHIKDENIANSYKNFFNLAWTAS